MRGRDTDNYQKERESTSENDSLKKSMVREMKRKKASRHTRSGEVHTVLFTLKVLILSGRDRHHRETIKAEGGGKRRSEM